MAHFAKVIDGVVENVIVAEQDFIDSGAVGSPSDWVQTSYNTYGGKHWTQNEDGTVTESSDQSKALRKNFAGIGMNYDGTGFYMPKPYESWTLNSTTYQWEAPIASPYDGTTMYKWNETLYQSDNTKGWEEL